MLLVPPQIEPFDILTSDNCDGEGTSSTAQPTAYQLYSEIDHLRKERDRAIEKLDRQLEKQHFFIQ